MAVPEYVVARARGALRGLLAADALAMPVHWFYDAADIARLFPAGVAKMEPAPPHHPHDFLRVSPEDDAIIGAVILKGRREHWADGIHVHTGMAAGDNTLNACCARLVMRELAAHGGTYDAASFAAAYEAFMTADPPKHPDTYAEGYHRAFFRNRLKGRPLDQCGEATQGTASAGGLVTAGPVAIAALLRTRNDVAAAQGIVRSHVRVTHPDDALMPACDEYVALLSSLLFRPDGSPADAVTRPLLDKYLTAKGLQPEVCAPGSDDTVVVGKAFSLACPINDSWPSVLYFATKYSASPYDAIVANVNIGGENAHRGSLVGCVTGAAVPSGVEGLFGQLLHRDAITAEIDALLGAALKP